MDVAGWALLAALAIAFIAMFAPRLLRGMRMPSFPRLGGVGAGALRAVLIEVGPRRCLAAADLLERLSGEDTARIAAAWGELEGPLLEALPDCPPDAKERLAVALANCASACRHRASAQGMMSLRNSLLSLGA
jgi:hypothetical protein